MQPLEITFNKKISKYQFSPNCDMTMLEEGGKRGEREGERGRNGWHKRANASASIAGNHQYS